MSINDKLTTLDYAQCTVEQLGAFIEGEHFVCNEIFPGNYIIILADYKYWSEAHYDELEQWALRHEHGMIVVSGMTVQIQDPVLMLEFILRWS